MYLLRQQNRERKREENNMSNVNVINKAEKDLDVTVNNVDGNIQILSLIHI